MGERGRDKKAKFVELAEMRVNRILQALDSLSKLSNRKNYEYDQEQVKKIFKAISEKTKSAERLFSEGGAGRPFRLNQR